jgi:hypothetical protein
MGNIKKETSKLSSEYIPVINESFVVDQSWIEMTKLMQSYDLSGDEYYIKKVTEKFKRFNNALDDLLEITSKSENMQANHKEFLAIKEHADLLRKI